MPCHGKKATYRTKKGKIKTIKPLKPKGWKMVNKATGQVAPRKRKRR